MATEVGALIARLEAETSQFRSEIRRAEGSMRRSGKSINNALSRIDQRFVSLGRVVRRFALAFGGAFSVQAIARIAESANALDTFSRATGFGVERIQEFRAIASQLGIDVRGVDDSLRRASRRLGLFAQGQGGPAAKALESLGFSVTDVKNGIQDLDSFIIEISDRISRLGTEAERSARSSEIFGDDFGPKLTPILARTREELQAAIRDVRNLGLVISEEQNTALAEAGRQFDLLKQRIGTDFTRAVADNAEQIQRFVESLTVFVTSIVQFFGVVDRALTSVGERIARLRGLSDSANIIERIAVAEDKLAQAEKRLAQSIEQRVMQQRSGEQEFEAFGNVEENERRVEDLRNQLAGLRAEQDAIRRGLIRSGTTGFIDDLDEILGGLGDRSKQQGEETGRSFAQGIVSGFDEVDLGPVRNPFAGAFPRRRDEGLAAGEVGPPLPIEIQLQRAEEQAEKTFAQIREFAERAAENIQDAFANFLFDPFDQGLKGMLRSFIDTIRRMVAEGLAARILGGPAISSLFTALAGVAAGGGGIQTLQTGGRLGPGQLGLVGEAGPEFITGPATVTPMGGAPINVSSNVTIEGSADDRILRQLPIILQENNQRLKAELLDEFSRRAFG